MKHNIEQQLHSIRERNLSTHEKAFMWQEISLHKASTSHRSFLAIFKYNYMTALIIALAFLVGGGGVVAASDHAKPGDALYRIDLATERAELSFAGETKKNDLAIKFANERIHELDQIKVETVAQSSTNGGGSTTDPTQPTVPPSESTRIFTIDNVTKIEATIFTDITIVTVEVNDPAQTKTATYGFMTPGNMREKFIGEVSGRYKLERSRVEKMITVTTEDRASTAADRDFIFLNTNIVSVPVKFTDKEKHDIEAGLAHSIKNLNGTSTTSVQMKATLNAILHSSEDDGQVEYEHHGQDFQIKGHDGQTTQYNVDDEDNESGDDTENQGSTTVPPPQGGGQNQNYYPNPGTSYPPQGQGSTNSGSGNSGSTNINLNGGININN